MITLNPDTLPVLLLDEIGLAEESPHKPLKILHQLLEHAEISFVGLSNWSLDSAKINRCIVHSCPKLTIEDLIATAQTIAEQILCKKLTSMNKSVFTRTQLSSGTTIMF